MRRAIRRPATLNGLPGTAQNGYRDVRAARDDAKGAYEDARQTRPEARRAVAKAQQLYDEYYDGQEYHEDRDHHEDGEYYEDAQYDGEPVDAYADAIEDVYDPYEEVYEQAPTLPEEPTEEEPSGLSEAQAAPLFREITELTTKNEELRAKYIKMMGKCRWYHVTNDKLTSQLEAANEEIEAQKSAIADLKEDSELLSVVMDTWVRGLTGRSMSSAPTAAEKAVLIDTGLKRWSNSLDSLKANNDALRKKNDDLEQERAQLALIVDSSVPIFHDKVLGRGPVSGYESLDEKQAIMDDTLIETDRMVREAEEAVVLRQEKADLEQRYEQLEIEKGASDSENARLQSEKADLEQRFADLTEEKEDYERIANGCVSSFNEQVLDRAAALSGDETLDEKENILRDGFIALGQTKRQARRVPQLEADKESLTKERDELTEEKKKLTKIVDSTVEALSEEILEDGDATKAHTLDEKEEILRTGLTAAAQFRQAAAQIGELEAQKAELTKERDDLSDEKKRLTQVVDSAAAMLGEQIPDLTAPDAGQSLNVKEDFLRDGLAAVQGLRHTADRVPDLESDKSKLEARVRALQEERDALVPIVDSCAQAFNDTILGRDPLSGDETTEDKKEILLDGYAKATQLKEAVSSAASVLDRLEELEKRCAQLEDENAQLQEEVKDRDAKIQGLREEMESNWRF